MSQTQIKTDLLIIGAGSGGLSLAAGAVQMGVDVILLEGADMGGDCLNYGCVPSKALLAAALDESRDAACREGAPPSRWSCRCCWWWCCCCWWWWW